jgi:GNAT superfamily N-acetyltransferase
MSIVFELTDQALAVDIERIGEELDSFNERELGTSGRRPLAVFARNEGGEIVAGLSGSTAWGWLFVQWLFVSEAARGQGLAASLLRQAEVEAVARSCHGAWIDTFNPAALRVYQRAGYVPFGALDDFPVGRRRTFLQKRLTF